MKINTKEIFDRMDIQQIRNFILEGIEPIETYNFTYNQRLTEGSILIKDRLKKLYKNNEIEFTNAKDD